MIRDIGSIPVSGCDDANVPMNCFISPPDREYGMWTWHADNFMPRKGYMGGSYRMEADSKEEIIDVLRKHVVPLYQIAFENMRDSGHNYYWEKNEESK